MRTVCVPTPSPMHVQQPPLRSVRDRRCVPDLERRPCGGGTCPSFSCPRKSTRVLGPRPSGATPVRRTGAPGPIRWVLTPSRNPAGSHREEDTGWDGAASRGATCKQVPRKEAPALFPVRSGDGPGYKPCCEHLYMLGNGAEDEVGQLDSWVCIDFGCRFGVCIDFECRFARRVDEPPLSVEEPLYERAEHLSAADYPSAPEHEHHPDNQHHSRDKNRDDSHHHGPTQYFHHAPPITRNTPSPDTCAESALSRACPTLAAAAGSKGVRLLIMHPAFRPAPRPFRP
jgi:hypothetical protein